MHTFNILILVTVAEQEGSSLTQSVTPSTGFLATRDKIVIASRHLNFGFITKNNILRFLNTDVYSMFK